MKKRVLPARYYENQESRLRRRARLSSKFSRRNKQRVPPSRNSKRNHSKKLSWKYHAMNMCYTVRVTSDVVVSCMWENVSTDSNWFVDVDVGASNLETLCRWLAVSNDKRRSRRSLFPGRA